MESEFLSLVAVFLDVLLFALGAVVVFLYGHAALWAFRIRKALMSPLYRERARWVGIVASSFVALVSSNLLIRLLDPSDFYLSLLEYAIVDVAGIVTLAWIDTTIKMARFSDPLNRNTFKWKQLRILVWFFTFLTSIGEFVPLILFRINYFTVSGTGGAFISGSFGWVILGFIALVLSYRRSRDPVLREHLKWLGLFLFLLFIVDTVLSAQPGIFQIAAEILLAIDAYFLYRGAKTLAPFARAPLDRATPSSTLSDDFRRREGETPA